MIHPQAIRIVNTLGILFLLLMPSMVKSQVYGPYYYTVGSSNYSLKSTFTSVWGGTAVQWQIDIKNTGTTSIDMDHASVWMSSSMVPAFNNFAGLGGVSWPNSLNRNVVSDVPNSIYQDTIILPTGSWVVSHLSPGNQFSIQYTFNVASISSSEQLALANALQFYAYTWPMPSLFVPVTFNFSGAGSNSVTLHTRKVGSTSYDTRILNSGSIVQLRNATSYNVYADHFSQGSTLYTSSTTSSSPLTFSTASTSTVNISFTSTVIPSGAIPLSVSGLPAGGSATLTLTGTTYPSSHQINITNASTSTIVLPYDTYHVQVTKFVDEINHKISSPCYQQSFVSGTSASTLVIHFATCDIQPFGVPGWPNYLAMGTVTQPAPSMDAGLHATPVDAIFKYSGNDGAGDRGLSYLTNPYLQNATIGTIQQARRLEHYYDSVYSMNGFRVMPVMIHYTANGSGGGTVGAAPDILDSANLRIHFINLIKETQIMLSYKDSAHPYPGTFILSPDLLGALQQDNSSQNTFPAYNYNNPSNFNANLLKSKVYVNQKLAEAFVACGLPTTTLPVFKDSLKGYFQAMNYLVHHVGDNSVLVSWQENLWATGSANWIHTSATGPTVGQQVANFLKDSLQVFTGQYKPDFFVIDRYERDCFSPGTSGSYAYNANKWQKTLDYAGHIAKQVQLPLMLWQFPGGHLVHKDSAIVQYDLANHASACGTWFMGEPSIGTTLSNIKSSELAISIPPGNYAGASTVQQLLAQDAGYNWGQSQLQNIAQQNNVFAILWGGGSTTGVYDIGTNGYDDGWLAGKLRNYYSNGKVYKTDSLCNLDDSSVSVKIIIEGYYAGSGMMAPVLMNQGMSSLSTVSDSITIELRQATSPFALVSSRKVVLSTTGSAMAKFPSFMSGQYYLAIKHRNAIPTWSSVPVSLGQCPVTYDFTTASSKAYGNNLKEIEPGLWAIYSGELFTDDNIDLLDLSVLQNDIFNFAFGYQASDLNGDGNVDLLDAPIEDENINQFIFSNYP